MKAAWFQLEGEGCVDCGTSARCAGTAGGVIFACALGLPLPPSAKVLGSPEVEFDRQTVESVLFFKLAAGTLLNYIVLNPLFNLVLL